MATGLAKFMRRRTSARLGRRLTATACALGLALMLTGNVLAQAPIGDGGAASSRTTTPPCTSLR
jgi:hypothetical protein